MPSNDKHGKTLLNITANQKNHFYSGKIRWSKPAKLIFLCASAFLLVMCSYYYGIQSSRNKLEISDYQLEMLKAAIIREVFPEGRVKRDLSDVMDDDDYWKILKQGHRITKRNARDENDNDEFIPTGGGVTYVRWGRKNCPSNDETKLVYEGVAAGAHYTYSGGGSDVLCIDAHISYNSGVFVDGDQGEAHIYGLEYRQGAWADPLFNFSLIEGNNVRLHDVPCAVCMATARFNQLMIPGRDYCPKGWTKEYTGYIMTSHHTHAHSSPHLCIDDTPQVVPGSEAEQPGELLYMVEAQCPSLQCEPFVNGRELRCVVCTI